MFVFYYSFLFVHRLCWITGFGFLQTRLEAAEQRTLYLLAKSTCPPPQNHPHLWNARVRCTPPPSPFPPLNAIHGAAASTIADLQDSLVPSLLCPSVRPVSQKYRPGPSKDVGGKPIITVSENIPATIDWLGKDTADSVRVVVTRLLEKIVWIDLM